MILRCATTNPGKLREFRAAAVLLGYPSVDIQPLDNLKDLPPCREDGATFEANAVKKAIHYSRFTPDPLFADDSGLEVDALGGAPGVFSARYSPAATDAANNLLLLERLDHASDRSARFVCAIALARQGTLLAAFHGEVHGAIAHSPSGNEGFGYDPLFFYPPFGRTFAQIPAAEKMSISHRGQALRALFDYCARLG